MLAYSPTTKLPMSAISSVGLTKIYRSRFRGDRGIRALNEFSIDVHRGEIFSLLGPNGAGKTTFIKILLSLTHPSSGRASMLGRELPDVQVKRRTGYLPENHRYPGYLTGPEVLSYFGRLSEVGKAALRPRIPALLSLVGLSDWSSLKVKKYSKGMLQRLGLAQAMVNNPDILFLDEPTDGVDPVGRKEIRDILRNLKGEGKTIFLNSHLLSEVELVSDRVAILDRGTLLKVGTVEELTSPGLLYEIGHSGRLPEEFQVEASARVLKATYAEGMLTVECRNTAELNAAIDLLRGHGVEITSVVKQRSTLEDSFLSLIRREVAP